MSSFPVVKAPAAVLEHTIDWDDTIEDFLSSDTISTSDWAITPSGELTVDSDTNTDTTASVVLSGGVNGRTYDVHNTIVTDAGRTYIRGLRVRLALQ